MVEMHWREILKLYSSDRKLSSVARYRSVTARRSSGFIGGRTKSSGSGGPFFTMYGPTLSTRKWNWLFDTLKKLRYASRSSSSDEKLLSPPSSKSTPSHRLSGVSFPAVTPPLQGVNPGKLEQRLFCECFLWPSFNHRCCNSHVKFCCAAKCLRQL